MRVVNQRPGPKPAALSDSSQESEILADPAAKLSSKHMKSFPIGSLGLHPSPSDRSQTQESPSKSFADSFSDSFSDSYSAKPQILTSEARVLRVEGPRPPELPRLPKLPGLHDMRRATLQRSLVPLSLGLVLLISACGNEPPPRKAPPPPEVDIMQIEPSTVRETSEYLGSLATRRSVTVLPQIAGYVHRILVKPGQQVVQGETLIEVDSRQETAALSSARAQVEAAQASLELAQQTLERSEALHQSGIASAQELEQSRANAKAAKAALTSAKAQEEQRRVQLQYFAVRAPFAGTVGDVLVRLGDFVSAATALTSIAQADVLEVSVSIPPQRARRVSVGTEIELLADSGELLLTAPVFFIAPQADPRTQLVEVKAAFHNEIGLKPSEKLRARIIYSRREALQIPALAVLRQSGQAFALKVSEKDGQSVVERSPIELGPLDSHAYVVESGLEKGEHIAVSSIQVLRDGQAIVPRPVPSLAQRQKESSPGAASGPSDR